MVAFTGVLTCGRARGLFGRVNHPNVGTFGEGATLSIHVRGHVHLCLVEGNPPRDHPTDRHIHLTFVGPPGPPIARS